MCLPYPFQELSGDLMADLTTPLLDTVINKLANPTLDCKALMYESNSTSESSTNSAGSSTIQIQPSIPSISEEISLLTPTPIISPTTHPITVLPTTPLYCPNNFTGTREVDGCTGERSA